VQITQILGTKMVKFCAIYPLTKSAAGAIMEISARSEAFARRQTGVIITVVIFHFANLKKIKKCEIKKRLLHNSRF